MVLFRIGAARVGLLMVLACVMVLSGWSGALAAVLPDVVAGTTSGAPPGSPLFQGLCSTCRIGDVLLPSDANPLGSVDGLDFHGVDRSGSEYACVEGWGMGSGPYDLASVQSMRTWNVTAVRVPLNEDCWLGINGVSASYSGAAYRDFIVNYTYLLQSQGIRPILDLHWNNASTYLATEQQPMADQDHAPAFWSSVASTFKNDPAVIFDLYNEPYGISWACWDHGCNQTVTNPGWQTAGMQELVNVTRAAGARNQLILLGGLNWAANLSEFLAYLPIDPAGPGHLAASIHVYNQAGCSDPSCWNYSILPILKAGIPVITGELGETDCNASFIRQYFDWANPLGIPYLGWAWTTYDSCAGPTLIANYSGTPYDAYGSAFEQDLKNFSATPLVTPPYAPESLSATPGPGYVKLSWKAPSLDGNSSLANYTVLYGPAGHFSHSLSVGSGTATSQTVSGLTGGTSYGFAVEAWNSMGAGIWSSIVNATPASSTIGSGYGAGSVEQTICMWNAVTYQGNAACPSDGDYPTAVAIGGHSGDLYVAQGELDAVQVISPTTGSILKLIPVGDDPDTLVYDAANEDVYVGNVDSDNVTAISDVTQTVVANISLSGSPYAIGFDSANGELYVANYLEDLVQVICGADAGCGVPNSVVATIGVGKGPEGVAFDATNDRIYVSNARSGNVSVICAEVSTCGTNFHKVVASIGVGNYPFGVAWDSYSNQVYVVNDASDNVSVIAPGTSTVAATFQVGTYPGLATFDSANDVVYIANSGSDNVTAICGDPTDCGTILEYATVANIPVGAYPVDLAYDSSLSAIYVQDQNSANITAISTTTNSDVANFLLGFSLAGLSYDPSDEELYVGNFTGSNLELINGSLDSWDGTLPTGSGPADTAYDAANGYVYVTNDNNDNVTVYCGNIADCGALWAVRANVGVGVVPQGVAFDPTDGEVYVTNLFSDNVTVICGESIGCGRMDTTVANITVGADPENLAFDPEDGEVYVALSGPGVVEAICGASTGCGTLNTVVTTISIADEAQFLAFDPDDGEVYVTGYYSGSNVTAICGEATGCGTENTAVANIPVLGADTGIAFDSANGDLYVADNDASNVSVICANATGCGSKNTLIKNIPLVSGDQPWGVAYDPENEQVFVSNYNTGAVSVIGPPVYIVTVNEAGLPAGTFWNMTLGGQMESSISTTLEYDEINGSYAYTVHPVPGYRVSPASGTEVVHGNDTFLNLTFTNLSQTRFTVDFAESGLDTGTTWSVTLNGTLQSQTTTGVATPIAFPDLPDGNYSYQVSSVAGYTVAPSSGHVILNGTNVTVDVTYTPLPANEYSVTFTESGLTTGTEWNVTFNGTTQSSTTPTDVFSDFPNDTYSFSIARVGSLYANPDSGSITIAGASVTKSIAFSSTPTPETYSVSFVETGLPSGTKWSVTFNDELWTGAASTWTVSGLSNGAYVFKIANVSGYSASPASGTITVYGNNITEAITFTASGGGGGGTSGSGSALYLVVAVVALVAVAAIAGLLLMRRRKRAGGAPAPGQAPPPPGPAPMPQPMAPPTQAPPPTAPPPTYYPPPANLPPPPPPTPMPPPPTG